LLEESSTFIANKRTPRGKKGIYSANRMIATEAARARGQKIPSSGSCLMWNESQRHGYMEHENLEREVRRRGSKNKKKTRASRGTEGEQSRVKDRAAVEFEGYRNKGSLRKKKAANSQATSQSKRGAQELSQKQVSERKQTHSPQRRKAREKEESERKEDLKKYARGRLAG